jgi:HlyD family secretion protein
MKRLLWAGLGILVLIALGVWLAMRPAPPPEVRFAEAKREVLISTLTTNGKAEPEEWAAVRADRAGHIEKVQVVLGQHVPAGLPLLAIDSRADLDAITKAEARVAQAQAEVALLDAGGRASEKAALDASLRSLDVEAEHLKRDVASVNRLLEKKAATTRERQDLEDRLARVEAEREGLTRRRASLADTSDRAAAQARLKEAQAELESARGHLLRSVLTVPLTGTVYQLPVRSGGYLQPGDLVAEIGRLDRMRVIVYVDEPELGRVKAGQPVTITWDGHAGTEWTGAVDQLPTGITVLGNRQVGEIRTLVENPRGDLRPGANINARIQTAHIENTLTIPKEGVTREKGETVVFVQSGGTVQRRVVRLGAASLSRTEVLDGLKDGEAVALLTEQPLTPGQTVRRVE